LHKGYPPAQAVPAFCLFAGGQFQDVL